MLLPHRGVTARPRAVFVQLVDGGPPRLLDYRDATGRWSSDVNWGVYGFVRFGARAVAHNIFLDGNTFASSANTDKKAIVGEISTGIVGRWRWFELAWSLTYITDEFEAQQSSDTYGTLVISWVREF